MKLQVHGREVYAYTGGKPFDPRLPCVVFVHGAMKDHGNFMLLARWFAHHGWSVLAPDLPGHMRSAGPALASVEAMAAWLLALLDAAGVERAALAGHSLGSLVALEAAARAPDRATHLVMLGTAVPMPVPDVLLALGKSDPMAAIDRVVVYSFSTLAAKPSYPGPGVWLRGAGRALMRQVFAQGRDPLLFHTDFAACNNYRNGLAAAALVRCRASLVLGRFDQMTWTKGAEAVAALLKAEVHTVPAGHFLMQECPDGVLNALRKALTDEAPMDPTFKTFAEFYPFYLGEHRNRTCRRLHFVGTSLSLLCLVMLVASGRAQYLLYALLCGYAFAWIGHFFFEKNKPATFKYPLYSFVGDWAMYRDIWVGRIKF